MRKILSIALAIFVASIVTAVAEIYPSRPITIVVPFPAGGPTDALARVLVDRMTRALAQSVIVENVTGAAGTIGAAHTQLSPVFSTSAWVIGSSKATANSPQLRPIMPF